MISVYKDLQTMQTPQGGSIRWKTFTVSHCISISIKAMIFLFPFFYLIENQWLPGRAERLSRVFPASVWIWGEGYWPSITRSADCQQLRRKPGLSAEPRAKVQHSGWDLSTVNGAQERPAVKIGGDLRLYRSTFLQYLFSWAAKGLEGFIFFVLWI